MLRKCWTDGVFSGFIMFSQWNDQCQKRGIPLTDGAARGILGMSAVIDLCTEGSRMHSGSTSADGEGQGQTFERDMNAESTGRDTSLAELARQIMRITERTAEKAKPVFEEPVRLPLSPEEHRRRLEQIRRLLSSADHPQEEGAG